MPAQNKRSTPALRNSLRWSGALQALFLFSFLGVALLTYRHFRDWDYKWEPVSFSHTFVYRDDNARLPPASPQRVVFFGDSLTYHWKIADPEFFLGHDRIDRGIPGDTTENMVIRFQQDVIDLHPQTVHILAGINDLTGIVGPERTEDIEANIRTMTELAQAHHIHVILASLLPCVTAPWPPYVHPSQRIQELNRWLKAYAAQQQITYVDYYDALVAPDGAVQPQDQLDSLHINRNGYRKIEPLVEPLLPS